MLFKSSAWLGLAASNSLVVVHLCYRAERLSISLSPVSHNKHIKINMFAKRIQVPRFDDQIKRSNNCGKSSSAVFRVQPIRVELELTGFYECFSDTPTSVT